MSHFSVFIHDNKIFYYIHPHISFLYILPFPPLLPNPRQDLLYFLFSIFEERHFCLRKVHREFHCDISVCICIITWIGSCPCFGDRVSLKLSLPQTLNPPASSSWVSGIIVMHHHAKLTGCYMSASNWSCFPCLSTFLST
jgi:hypothetical protein